MIVIIFSRDWACADEFIGFAFRKGVCCAFEGLGQVTSDGLQFKFAVNEQIGLVFRVKGEPLGVHSECFLMVVQWERPDLGVDGGSRAVVRD